MKKIFSFIHRILKLPELVHETLHYIPAWLWRLEPRIDKDWNFITHRRTTDGKNMVILLMPTFVGLFAFPLVLNIVIHRAMFYIALIIFWVGWMAACGKDIYKAGYFILFKRWHDREEQI